MILLHMVLPVRARNAFLLCASVFFYAWGEITYVPLVVGSMLANYAFGYLCASRRAGVRHAGLAASLLLNMGALLYFKYAAFLLMSVGLGAIAPSVALPLGISFYTFQTQAYVIDVHRGKVEPERSFIDYATFILLFPQLIAGPIVLYTDVRRELKKRAVDAAGLEAGIATFVCGLAAKVLLANPLGALWETVHALAAPSTGAAWLGIAAYGLQIYFDFSGYSLMAIGMGRMLGFRFPRNFDHPYASRSIREFWRRWHMTLGSWFREYVYFPLGGSRRGKARTVLNLLVVWALTGLWHGASWNFLAWGLWFFVFLALERLAIGGWLARHRAIGLAYTLLVVFVGWALFAHESLTEAARYIGRMFAFAPGLDWRFPLRNNAVLLGVSLVACLPGVAGRVKGLLRGHAALRAACVLCVLLLCIAGLVGEEYNPFLYFRF
ncbi:MBOAT family protein [Eubacteriales bacterium OttesenSCG-928-A19]|nr:MBOAT family protein [Eubacteriales bacterium OttesenSCG-928-A19]